MEKDLELLDQVLTDMRYSEEYRNQLISDIKSRAKSSEINRLTDRFIYVNLIYPEGKEKASEIAEYWQELKELGSYKTKIQKALEKSSFKKYMN